MFKRNPAKSLFISIYILFLSAPTNCLAEIKEIKDLSYGYIEREAVDLYLPENPEGAEVVFFVHGGGWSFGNKRHVHKKPKVFSEKGFILISIGYPLLPEHKVESQANSIAKAIAWSKRYLKRLKANTDALHLLGHSAGAHLVSLVALDSRYLSTHGVDPETILSVTSIDGAALNIVWQMKNPGRLGQFARRYYSAAFGEDPSYWKRLSPVNYLKDTSKVPLFLFLTAEDETLERLKDSRTLESFAKTGTPAITCPVPNRGHLSINRRLGTKNDKAFLCVMKAITKSSVGIRTR